MLNSGLRTATHRLALIAAVPLAFAAGALARSKAPPEPLSSAVIAEAAAKREGFEWGSLHTYFAGRSYGTQDGLAAVAVIKPGAQIHPPHQHSEEEYLMVLEGQGTWSLNGRDFPANAGDMLYAAPWDWHGIKNTGKAPLKFVVWKWNGQANWKPPSSPAKPKAPAAKAKRAKLHK